MKFAPKNKYIAVAFLALALVAAPASAIAHHSFAQYDASQSITIEATVVEFGWVSPHAWATVTVDDENGNPVEWTLELESLGQIYRRGWRPDTLKPGDIVSFDIAPLKSGEPGGGVRTATLADGTTLFSRNLE